MRRCSDRPAGSGACAAAQLGVALCPCRGDLDEDRYRSVVATLVAGIDEDPRLLLDPLADKMDAYAAAQRYEEAANLRDRHAVLARAIESRRRWQALTVAGRLEVEHKGGECALVDRGRLVASWRREDGRPLALSLPVDPAEAENGTLGDPHLPPSVAAAEEAALVWRWLTDGAAVAVEAEGPLAVPARPVPALHVGPVDGGERSRLAS